MILMNNAACIIIIPGMGDGKSLDGMIAPLQTLDVPDALCGHPFVQGCIERGELVKRGESAPVESTLDALRRECDEQGIEYDKRWGEAKLREALQGA